MIEINPVLFKFVLRLFKGKTMLLFFFLICVYGLMDAKLVHAISCRGSEIKSLLKNIQIMNRRSLGQATK